MISTNRLNARPMGFHPIVFAAAGIAILLLCTYPAVSDVWLSDVSRGTDCQVYSWRHSTGTAEGNYARSFWTGSCLNGKAKGEGYLVIFNDRNQQLWGLELNNDTHMTMEDGHIQVSIPNSKLQYSMKYCDRSDFDQVLVTVTPDKSVQYVHFDEIAFYLLEHGARYAIITCPSKDNVRVQISRASPDGLFDTADGMTNWVEYTNIGVASATQENIRLQQQAKQAAERQQEQKRLAEQEAKKMIDSKALHTAFTEEAGIDAWVAASKLAANPFVYEGQNVGLVARFETMIASDRALFNAGGEPFVVSGVPGDRFRGKGTVALAGRVLGKDSVRIPIAGEVQVPHLEYTDARDCEQRGCAEMFLWQN